MVRHVCAGFEDAPFSLVDAARRMIQLYPTAPSEAFSEGWDVLLRNREIVPETEAAGRFRLQKATEATEGSQAQAMTALPDTPTMPSPDSNQAVPSALCRTAVR